MFVFGWHTQIIFNNCEWVVLIYNIGTSDARFMHKLSKHVYIVPRKLCTWKTILCGISDLVVAQSNTYFSTTSHEIKWCFLDWLTFTYLLLALSRSRSVKKVFLEFTRKRMCWSLFLMELLIGDLKVYWRQTPAQVFSCEFCTNFKNTFSQKTYKWLLPKPCARKLGFILSLLSLLLLFGRI